jgi:O-antigen ligase
LLLIGLAVVLWQLIPLPPSLWQELPGRDRIVAGYALLDQPLPWLPVSLAPINTAASALWLLPPAAVLLGMVKLGFFRERLIAWAITVVAGISVLIGSLQVVGGEDSPLYFYRITNFGKATGFFANSSHEAMLLLVSIPFLTALYVHYSHRSDSQQHRSSLLVVLVMSLLTIFVGLALNASAAGLLLVVPVVAASALAYRRRRRTRTGRRSRTARLYAVGAAVAAIAAVTAVTAFYSPAARELASNEYEASAAPRAIFFSNTMKAARDHFPVGSGVGTFIQIYPSYEDPSEANRTIINHAHSDYLELLLETGLPGMVVLVLFLFWWASRSITIWRSDDPGAFARAATIASATVLAHSAVEFPLRSTALTAVFAACCALMAAPRARGTRRNPNGAADGPRARHLTA